jgi:polyphosphate kinase 2 (PPK2 family)
MIDGLRVAPDTRAEITARDPRDLLGFEDERAGKQRLAELTDRLSVLQGRVFAEGERSVLLVLQGLDASGKDGVIRTVFTGVSPQGCSVVSFRRPTATELAHDYLWRVQAELPARGSIGVFNRSHYEDVVSVRIHELAPEEIWRRRPGHIREWGSRCSPTRGRRS